ncbi:hypothetical protein CRUP_033365 [Coryphaenoides rupestris]|nr:hypothetical protein CRUP_033365 [Coryphaenoides rupestris]
MELNIACLTSTLPVIPYQKLTDLRHLGNGGFGAVFKAQHSNWRTSVAIKCLKILDCPDGERQRNCLLKEAEVLHKARFNYIIQIFGVCHEPEFFCIVTEYMCNGSLDRLLHAKDTYPRLHWPVRLRILYEIALGVNFLHNMNPPLLHLDLKTQNILLDAEFHAKIADFGLSKWRQLSMSQSSTSKPGEIVGTIIYMPPEEYKPNKNRKPDVKYDMYSYAVIMWEVLSRQIPFKDSNIVQLMLSVLEGARPDTGPACLPADTPGRETLVDLMTCGWTANPDDRPTFLRCVTDLEPMLRRYDNVDFLEAEAYATDPRSCPSSVSDPSSGSSDISQPGPLTSLDTTRPMREELGRAACGDCAATECETLADLLSVPPEKQDSSSTHQEQASPTWPLQGPAGCWMTLRREEITENMTEACLNQSLDGLLARRLMMREDYELVVNQTTRTAKVRQLLDTAHRQSEDFCCLVVNTLYKNKQKRLQPYPAQVISPTTMAAAGSMASAPPLCLSIARR